MKQQSAFVRNTVIYTIGNFGSNVFRFLIFPLYTFFLTKEQIGTYDLYITGATLLVPVVSLQLGDAAYRWLIDADRGKGLTSVVISTNFVYQSIISGVILVLTAILSPFVNAKYAFYLALVVILSMFFKSFQQISRGLGNNKIYASGGILNTFFLLLFNLLFLSVFKWNIDGIFLALILSYLFATLFIVLRGKISQHLVMGKASGIELKKMVAYSWPLIPNTIAWWIINASDKFLILYYLGVEANGIYSISSKIPAVILMVNSIFALAWQDHLIGAKDAGSDSVANHTALLRRFIKLELSFAFIIISASPFLTKFLVAEEFYESWKFMPLLIMGAVFMSLSSFLGASYLKMKKTSGVFYTSLISGIVNIIVSLLLLKSIGLYAAALGSALSFLVMFSVRGYQVRTHFRIRAYFKVFGLLLAIGVLMVWLMSLDYPHIHLICVVFSTILFFIINWAGITWLFSKIRSKLIKNRSLCRNMP